jgi:1,2-diacylglycerol 3-alpha-glucosyltransferase
LGIGLKEHGHEVLFLTLGKPISFYPGEDPDCFVKADLGKFIWRRVMEDYAPDVVITNGNSPLDMLVLDYVKKHNIFTVSYVHQRYEKVLEQRYLPWGKYWPEDLKTAVAEVFLKQFRNADIIIALNAEMRTYLETHLSGNRIFEVSNGIDLKQFPFRQREISPDKTVNLLYVANLEKRKNQLFLLKVIKQLPVNYILHLVGGSEEPDYSFSFKRALRNDFQDGANVIFYGKVDPGRVRELYDLAHLFVDVSLAEAQSVVLIEAIASGLPVVRLFSENTAGVTEDGVTAVHIPEAATPEEFAKAITDLAADPELYLRLAQNQKRIRGSFARENSVKQLLAIIKEHKH